MLSRRQCRAVRLTSGRPPNEGVLFELHHSSLDVLTPRTFESTEIEARLLQLNARQIHLHRALWARGPCVNWRVFKRVFGKRHLRLLLLAGAATGTLGHRRPDHELLSVMYLNTIEQVELCKIAHTTRYVDNLVDALCIRCTKYNENFSYAKVCNL